MVKASKTSRSERKYNKSIDAVHIANEYNRISQDEKDNNQGRDLFCRNLFAVSAACYYRELKTDYPFTVEV